MPVGMYFVYKTRDFFVLYLLRLSSSKITPIEFEMIVLLTLRVYYWAACLSLWLKLWEWEVVVLGCERLTQKDWECCVPMRSVDVIGSVCCCSVSRSAWTIDVCRILY